MKYFISICLLILLTTTITGQLPNAEGFLNGSYDKKYIRDNKIKQITVNNNISGEKSSLYIFDFDKKGLLKKQTIFNKHGNKVNDYIFKYNKYYDQIERTNMDYGLKKIYKVRFSKEYNNSLLVSEKSSEFPFITKYSYNSQRQKTEAIILLGLDTANASKRIFYYTYGLSGKLKEIKEVLINQDVINNIGTINYFYNENGRLVSYQKENSPIYFINYDNKGLIKSTSFKMTEEFSNLEFVDTYNYSFWE